jgi:hypothetical protein
MPVSFPGSEIILSLEDVEALFPLIKPHEKRLNEIQGRLLRQMEDLLYDNLTIEEMQNLSYIKR